MGKKYSVAYRHVIKNYKKKTINYPKDIDELTSTRTDQLIYEGGNKKM